MGLFQNLGDSLANRVGLGSPKGKSDYKGIRSDWMNEANKWSDEWGKVADFTDDTGARTRTGKRFDELSDLYTGEVNQGAARAGEQTAANYSRRGMGDSGYAASGQQNVMIQAALARAKAREAARQAAVGESEDILGQRATLSLSPYPSIFEAASQRYLGNEAQLNKYNYQQMLMEEKAALDFASGWGGFGLGMIGGGK